MYCEECKTLMRYAEYDDPVIKDENSFEDRAVEQSYDPTIIDDQVQTPAIAEENEEEYDSCEFHPNYKGIRKPRTDCSICWQVYLTNNR